MRMPWRWTGNDEYEVEDKIPIIWDTQMAKEGHVSLVVETIFSLKEGFISMRKVFPR